MAPIVVIVGPPASGKSTIGAALADTLQVGFCDTDTQVESEAQSSVSDIFLLDGEAEFRRLEQKVATTALERCDGVLALGSGAIESEMIREILDGHFVVQLRLGAAVAAKRAGIAGARPVRLGNIRSQWSKSMARRETLYAETADMVIDTEAGDVAGCVSEIAAEVRNGQQKSAQVLD